MRTAFAGLVVAGMLLLGSMMYITASIGSAHADPDVLMQQLTRMHGSQLRLENELRHISSRLDKLGARPAEQAALQPPVVVAQAAVDRTLPAAVGPEACPGRRPFHALLTAQSSPYQQWQARIMYYHWKKQAAAAGPCGEMGAFTRLCATEGAKPDGLETEIPSVFTRQLPAEVCSGPASKGVPPSSPPPVRYSPARRARHRVAAEQTSAGSPLQVLASHFQFGVLNRPESVRQLLASPELLSKITSDYVLILETDHVLMQPIPNLASETKPAAYAFGYMHAHVGQNRIIRKYWPEGDASQLDPVGPSPLLIHLDQLRQVYL